MKDVAELGELDFTNKKFTNHRQTTVRKLQKAGISNDRIAAITGHRNEQSLGDYAEADPDDHRAISTILSKPHSLKDVTNYSVVQAPSISSMVSSAALVPQYNFTNCSIYFGSNSSSMSRMQMNCVATASQKKR